MGEKICKKCQVLKSVDNFYYHKAVCKNCLNERKKEYRLENIVKIKAKSKDWYNKTKEFRREHKASYYRNRRKNDSLFSLRSGLVRLIRTSIKRGGFTKTSKTVQILGCSYEEFKEYLESKFEPWMNWDNKGLYNGQFNYGWDIDHIIPASSGITEDEIIKLNHYTNLQPLCSKINRDIKRNK